MVANPLSCPKCQEVLQTPVALGNDPKLQCPKCGAVFAAHEATSARAAFGSAAPSQSLPEPARRQRGSLLLVLGVLVLLLAGGTVAAYVWPGFMVTHANTSSGDEDPLAFLPGDAQVIFGLEQQRVIAVPGVGLSTVLFLMHNIPGPFEGDCRKLTGIDSKELLDRVTFAFDTFPAFGPLPGDKEPKVATAVIQSSRPFNPTTIAKGLAGAVPRQAQGKTYYEIHEQNYRTLYMPSDRILVVSTLTGPDAEALVTSDGKQVRLPPALAAMARAVKANPLWAAVPLDDGRKKDIEKFLIRTARVGSRFLKPFLSALQQAKAFGASGQTQETEIQLSFNLLCPTTDAAGPAAESLKEFWTTMTKPKGLHMSLIMKTVNPPQKALVNEIITNSKFTSQNEVARMTTALRYASINAVLFYGYQGSGFQPPKFDIPPPKKK